jgi:peptidoglycan/LPS O-acetylase OafA/YrhL
MGLIYRARGDNAKISRPQSVTLDAVRACAAMMVFASHWTTYSGNEQRYHAIYSLGFPGVIIFFVLSGYVIAATTASRETTASQYAIARISRLYSVCIPVLILLPVLDGVMSIRYPDAVLQMSENSHALARVGVSLVFANWWWFERIVPFSDGPYWSLSFEASYYLIWGLYIFGGKWRWYGVALASLMVGPKILLLFPIWLAGAAMQRSGVRFSRTGAVLALPVAAVCIVLGKFYNVLPADPWFEEASFPSHWLRGFGICLVLLSALTLSPLGRRGAIGWLADRSFTIYLLHYPLLKYISVIMGSWSDTTLGSVLLAVAALVLCLGVGSLIEPTRFWWRTTLTSGLEWYHLRYGNAEG